MVLLEKKGIRKMLTLRFLLGSILAAIGWGILDIVAWQAFCSFLDVNPIIGGFITVIVFYGLFVVGRIQACKEITGQVTEESRWALRFLLFGSIFAPIGFAAFGIFTDRFWLVVSRLFALRFEYILIALMVFIFCNAIKVEIQILKEMKEILDQVPKESRPGCFSSLLLGMATVPAYIISFFFCEKTGIKANPHLFGVVYSLFGGAIKGAAAGAVGAAITSDTTPDVLDTTVLTPDVPPDTTPVAFPSSDVNDLSNADMSAIAGVGGTVENSFDNNLVSPDNIFSQLSVIGTNDSGFETVSYNADNHTFYNHDGHEIARVQGCQVVDNMNHVIASYDPHTGNILDSNGNPINIAQTGDTFKTVTDVHGEGLETINGEVFDAKTHERIGNIRKI